MQTEDFRSGAVEQLLKVNEVKLQFTYLAKFKEKSVYYLLEKQNLRSQLQIARPLAIQIADFIVHKELQLETQDNSIEFVLSKLGDTVADTID